MTLEKVKQNVFFVTNSVCLKCSNLTSALRSFILARFEQAIVGSQSQQGTHYCLIEPCIFVLTLLEQLGPS